MKNIEVAGILSEIHPVAAGVYNTAYFVIINQKKHKPTNEQENATEAGENNANVLKFV